MCGFAGVWFLSGERINPGRIVAMNNSIRHRGPDDTGIWHDEAKHVFLGHQRLSIIDLSSTGHQPMIDEKGNVIVFNGEI